MAHVMLLLCSREGVRMMPSESPVQNEVSYLGEARRNGVTLKLKQTYRLRAWNHGWAIYEEERCALVGYGPMAKGEFV